MPFRGFKHSEQSKLKMKISHSYTDKIPWNKGTKGLMVAWNKGKEMSNEYKIAHKGFPPGPTAFKKGQFAGKLHSGWKGGGVIYLRNQCKVRDNYTCQICGLRDLEIMDVDHIKPVKSFPELKFILSNLQTICPNCHRRKTLLEYRLCP